MINTRKTVKHIMKEHNDIDDLGKPKDPSKNRRNWRNDPWNYGWASDRDR